MSQEEESWEKCIIAACTHYDLTGEILEILLPGFDQHGKWVDSFLFEVRILGSYFRKLKDATPSPEKMVIRTAAGEVLLCSIVDDFSGKVEIPFV